MKTGERKGAVGPRLVLAVMVAGTPLLLGGCSGFKDAIGATKQSPDEFAIRTRAPLAIPADFSLKPPQPGAPRPQEADTATRAQQALAGDIPARPATAGEKEFLGAAGAQKADPKIRTELAAEMRANRAEAARRSYADAVLFWQASPVDDGQPIDPNEEAERLKDKQGQPAMVASAAPAPSDMAKGDGEQPVIEKDGDSGGWFSGWF